MGDYRILVHEASIQNLLFWYTCFTTCVLPPGPRFVGCCSTGINSQLVNYICYIMFKRASVNNTKEVLQVANKQASTISKDKNCDKFFVKLKLLSN